MDRGKVLESWKEIAAYLGREVRTCQRWERELGLPVHRLDGSPKARVFAYPDELDGWRSEKLHEPRRWINGPGPSARQPGLRALLRRKKGLTVLAIAAAAVLLISIHFTRSREDSADAPGGKSPAPSSWTDSVAILPFEDLSPDHTLEYMCQSLTDNIATKLGSIGALKVFSRLSTRHFAGRQIAPGDVWRELKVGTILEATLQKQNGLLRVNVSLVRGRDGVYMWSRSYSRTHADTLQLEDEIFKDVAAQLGLELTPENQERSKRKDPKDDEGYDVFLLGRYFENRYLDSDDEEDFQKAVDYLTAYLDVNADFALAYCSLGNVYEHRFAVRDDPEDKKTMRLFYEKAYRLNPGLEETNLGLGWVHFYRRDLDRSYDYFRAAVYLGPANPEVNWNVGSFLLSIGLNEKAITYYEKALLLDPLNSNIHWLCAHSYTHVGEFERGLNSAEKAIALDPANIGPLVLSARLLLLLKRPEEAVLRLGQLPDQVKNRLNLRPLWALVSAVDEDREKALSILQELQRLDQAKRSIYLLDVAGVYSLLGMKDEALHTIEAGIRTGFAAVKMELYSYPLLRSYPYFDVLRDTPRFKAIERKQKKLYETRMEKYKGL